MIDKKKIILHVDDEPSVRKVLRRILGQHGYNVLSAANGTEALEMIESAPPDMVLLDLVMPGMNGAELCRRIRANPAIRHLPVVIVTAKGSIPDTVEGLDDGADDYVVKPFDPEELLARIDGLFRRCETQGVEKAQSGQTGSGTVLIVDDEPSARQVIARVLRRAYPGFAVAVAADIPEAERMLLDLRPRLVVANIHLPSGSGLDLCRFMQGHPWFYKTRVLIITAFPSSATLEQELIKGACEFLTKPFHPDELAHCLRRLLT
jgi:DNA-binding response OmpR family regulator